jgi:hypothetical protein
MISTPLIKYGKIELSHETEPAKDVEELIIHTLMGSPEGIRYRLLDSAHKIYNIKPLHFFPLRKNDNLLYVMALAERITAFNTNSFITYYVRYVTFNEALSTVERKTNFDNASKKRIRNSFFKEAMKKHAQTISPILKDPSITSDKKIYYAYVEESNFRSLDFTEFFFEKIRSFSVIPFSRIIPKKDSRVSLVSNEKEFLNLIYENYKNYSFFSLDENRNQFEYYVLIENNKIVAGLRAGIANWEIEQIPGLAMKMLLKVIPRIPFLNRIVRNGLFRFLTIDTIICNKNKKELLPNLFESVCAIKKVYSAMIYTDSDTEIYDHLKTLKKMGLLNRFFAEAKGAILARFVNFSNDEIKEFYKNPVYISGYDLS